jgi:urea transport system permease protein
VLAYLLLVWAPGTLTPFRLGNLGKYCCWAIAAVGIGLAWGRGGMLVMGQGVFFGLGGYIMAMHMKLEAAGPGEVPDFMSLYGNGTMPFWWEPFRSGTVTLIAIIVVPLLVSFLLGYAILKRAGQGGVLRHPHPGAGGGLLHAADRHDQADRWVQRPEHVHHVLRAEAVRPRGEEDLYMMAAGLLILCLVIVWQLYRSRFGELLVATRDAEERVRFLGYDPANIKLIAFVVAAVMASIGGAMFTPIAGIISPSNVDAAASIMLLAGVALGGRATLLGPALGAIAVGYGQSTLSESSPRPGPTSRARCSSS